MNRTKVLGAVTLLTAAIEGGVETRSATSPPPAASEPNARLLAAAEPSKALKEKAFTAPFPSGVETENPAVAGQAASELALVGLLEHRFAQQAR